MLVWWQTFEKYVIMLEHIERTLVLFTNQLVILQPVIFVAIFHSLSIKRLLNLDMAKEKERKVLFWRSYKQMRKADQFAESPIYYWTAGPISAI